MKKGKTNYQYMMIQTRKRVKRILTARTRYLIEERKTKISSISIRKKEYLGEIAFIENYFAHKNWIAQPANFFFNGTRYRPDFYCRETNTWIEVSATRQAYHANKKKYDLFRKFYPKLNFEIRKPSGKLLNEETRDKEWEQ